MLQLWGISVPLLTGKDMISTCCDVSLVSGIIIPSLSETIVSVKIIPAGSADLNGSVLWAT